MIKDFAPADLYLPARDIIRRLHAAGHEAYVAGGAVRDYLLGRPQTDLDIATSATPIEVRALFRRTFPVGESFGVIVVQSRGHAFDVATFREERDYPDGRHPDGVCFSTAQADVARRDFTINGLFWDTEREEVLDWVGGRADIAARVIRTIGPPAERFGEDRLRMLRAVRFAAQLDFALDEGTLAAIREQAGHLSVVSLERVRQELDKLLASPGAARGLDLLASSGLRAVLTDWLRREACRPARGSDLLLGPEPRDAWTQAWLAAREAIPPAAGAPLPVGLVCLLLDMAGFPAESWTPAVERLRQAALEGLMRALRGSRVEVALARSTAQLICRLAEFRACRLADQLRLLRLPECPGLLAVARQHPGFGRMPFADMAEVVARYATRWHPPVLIKGDQLLRMGFPAGPAMGALLEALETEQLEGRLETPEEAQAWLREKLP